MDGALDITVIYQKVWLVLKASCTITADTIYHSQLMTRSSYLIIESTPFFTSHKNAIEQANCSSSFYLLYKDIATFGN